MRYYETEASRVVTKSPTTAEQYIHALRDQLLASGQILDPHNPKDSRRFDLCLMPDRFPDGCQAMFHSLLGIALGPGPNEFTLEELDGVVGRHTCKHCATPQHSLAVFGVDKDAPLYVRENQRDPNSDWYHEVLFSAVKYFVAGEDPDNHYPADIVELDPYVLQAATSYNAPIQKPNTYDPVLVADSILVPGRTFRGHVLAEVGSLITAQAFAINQQSLALL
jgi:hypothetical protein